MILTLHRRPDAPTDPAGVFDPGFTYVYAPAEGSIGCPLTGPRMPSQWADEDEPFYLDVVRDLGLKWHGIEPAPLVVVDEELVAALPPTRPLPLADVVMSSRRTRKRRQPRARAAS